MSELLLHYRRYVLNWYTLIINKKVAINEFQDITLSRAQHARLIPGPHSELSKALNIVTINLRLLRNMLSEQLNFWKSSFEIYFKRFCRCL
ncbi:hypothetical protein CgunFtcFv8_025009 [Champsocephalus gunnari]|uniref:Uncharacterized protein n=1 Tax=Champsocephalus gunnari TaxID=52237 RepID=A0AAN8HN08_CHAGU|nr:hypothetical protein CgunFtcFv8_025009 [Champsocephalus gunnari]